MVKTKKHMKSQSVKNSPKAILIGGIGLLYLLFATTSPARIVTYGISHVTADLATHVLTIDGTFPTNRGAPTVTLASTPLPGTTLNQQGTQISATLPNSVTPGTYPLTVSFQGINPFQIDITIPGTPAGGTPTPTASPTCTPIVEMGSIDTGDPTSGSSYLHHTGIPQTCPASTSCRAFLGGHRH